MSGPTTNGTGSRIPKPTGSNPSSGFTTFPTPTPYTTSPHSMAGPSPRNVSIPTQYRPNNPFAQRQYSPQSQPQRQGQGPTAPLSVNGRRRPPDLDSPSTPTTGIRRPAVASTTVHQSPEVSSSLPRLSSVTVSPRLTQRAAPRQPSTPSLTTHQIPRKPVTDPVPYRVPPQSPTASTPPPAPSTLTTTQIAGDRVPSYIRIRLRLIKQLGAVLDLDSTAIAAKIDIPGLLARVDAAYARGHGNSSDEPASPAGGSPMELPRSFGGSGDDKAGHRESKTGGGMFGVFKRMGGSGKPPKASIEDTNPHSPRTEEPAGPAFGVSLNEMPNNAWCTSLIGGQKHELPLVVFTVIEEIYRRGMSQPGIFRLAGDGTRISHLTKVFNMPPLYGDSLSICNEPIHNLTGLVKRYIRDVPEPVLDESLFTAFIDFCLDRNQDFPADERVASVDPGRSLSSSVPARPLDVRITAAQLMLRLLPPLHFSLFIYLLAFLGQLPLFPDNRLNVESISIIFGPAMIAARGKGIPGLGPSAANMKNRDGSEFDSEATSEVVNNSQAILSWLLRHWGSISEKVLDNIDTPFHTPLSEENGPPDFTTGPTSVSVADTVSTPTTSLLAPVDIKASQPDTPFHQVIPPPRASSVPPTRVPNTGLNVSADSANSSSTGFSETPTATHAPSRPVSPGGSVSGIFARAFGSRPLSTVEGEVAKKPKRSASFTSISSISSLVKKGGAGWMGRSEPKGPNFEAARSLSAEKLTVREPAPGPGIVNPQISNVLGSLHDLLVSKDKQIERDARELALLRHTILDLDEKLSKAQHPCSCATSQSTVSAPIEAKESIPTPEIKITPTPSTIQLPSATQQEVSDLQTQLTTALAAAETARLGSRGLEKRILELEARLSRADSERGLEVGKLQMALAIEQGKVVALSEERDEARERLEKIKTTLFAVT